MSREKQIEEIKKVLIHTCIGIRTLEQDLSQDRYAKALYNAGYRKQSEGEWIDQYKGQHTNPIYMCSMCGRGTLLRPHINELDNMEMVQALSPFCPNCGAKMKGGAE